MNGHFREVPRVAEFFAGIGLVRMALEQEGCQVVFANDISVNHLEFALTLFFSHPSPSSYMG